MGFDKQFWDFNGYAKVENAAKPEDLQAVVDAIWNFTGKDPNNRDTWYQEPQRGAGMVNMSAHQAMWNNRQSPIIYEAFKHIWKQDNLWVTINRTNLNPPHGEHWEHAGMIHWDIKPNVHPIDLRVQGVLYLKDTDTNMGGFQCVPSSHLKLFEWVATHPFDEIATVEDCMEGLEVTPIAGKAGDYIMWQASLLHGNGKNSSDQPRFAQYICLTPEGYARAGTGLVEGGEELRQLRVDTWSFGPYQAALAEAIGTPEGFIEMWLFNLVTGKDGDHKMPRPQNTGKLAAEQVEKLAEMVNKAEPWKKENVQHAASLMKKYGVTASYLPAFLASQHIVEIIQNEFGIEFNTNPPILSDLGKKLVGVEKWS